jgi:branched-chain amino acid transport system ATP-binding protein
LLLIEHDVKLVMGLCDRVAVLDYGRKIAEGDAASVQRDAAVIAAYLGGSPA